MAVMKNEIREFQPVGMRVLAVDDNPTCLRVLDALLRKCQYHVTTTNQATTALKLLRDKKNNFDLVISDVDMPDMDGFKLLELVGLEMDLPVIMLSAHGDTTLVMKGISYGACDYLLKPVRTEELKNIWQHVLRRHKCDPRPRARNTSDNVNGDSAEDLMGKGGSDHHNPGMKRKDQNNDEDENAKPNQDPSIKKQPRVVWSPELHRKFVAAVHQLGTNKVGPKKILELMNVEKLRKENVASHLQKYRLHLKRISCEAKETKLVASLRSPHSAHLPNGAPNGVRNSGCLCASRGFLQASYRSFSPDSAFSRLNNPTGDGSCGGITQSCHAHISIDTMNRMNQSIYNSHGMPMPPTPSVDRPQYRRCSVQGHGDLSIINLDSGVNPTSSGFLDTKVDVGNAKSVFLTADSSVMLAGDFQDFQRKDFSGIQQSCVTAASNPEHSPNLCRSSDSWQNFVQSSLVLPEPSAIICSKESTSDDLIYKNSTLTTFPATGSHCLTSAAPQICGTPITRTDFQCWTPVLMSNIGESSNSTSIQDRNELQQNECFLSNFTSGLVSSLDPPHGFLGSFNHRLEPTNSRGNGDYLYHLPRLQMSVDPTPTDLHQVHLQEQRTPQRCLDYDNIGFL